ncbi:hypothetical protein [uncultured Algibacter sp.]|uniref:hypothetical protein n=1 Tax=uncultured Algibacter sp. TaxID=298659 RepID=UPI00262CC4F1|nr:hypothetical protein [uncultured Algibacter sp.]
MCNVDQTTMKNKLTIIIISILITGCVNKKEKLVDKIYSIGYPKNEIVVSLEDFFDGNNDRASIGPNIHIDQPSPQEFYQYFSELKKSEKVDDILIRIQDVEDLDWPFTDTVYIISELSTEELKSKLTDLKPDEIYDEWMYGKPINAPEIKDGFSIFSVWWD